MNNDPIYIKVKLPSSLKRRLRQHAISKKMSMQEEILARINTSFLEEEQQSCLAKIECWIESRKKKKGKDTKEHESDFSINFIGDKSNE